MLKTIFVPMNGSDRDRVALGTAFAVADLFESHVECVRINLTPNLLVWESDLMGAVGGVVEGNLIASLQKKDHELSTKAQRTFKTFCERRKVTIADAPGPVGVSARWREVQGHQVASLVAEARYHDLVVVTPNLLVETDPASDFVGDMMLDCGRPVLLAQDEAPKTLGKTVAVAWKNTPEAARAVTAAMPFLTQAEQVLVLSAAEDDESEEIYSGSAQKLVTTLRWNGCAAEHQPVNADSTAARAVLDHARKGGADLLVMGGYGHSRLRERVFGGFTAAVLERSPLPVLMVH